MVALGMRVSLQAALFSLLWPMAGCSKDVAIDASTTIGQVCEGGGGTGCATGACSFGRCRETCNSDGDCEYPSICLSADGDVDGVCRLPEESACSEHVPCPEGLVCATDNTCRNHCDGATPCGFGKACIDGACYEGGKGCVEQVAVGNDLSCAMDTNSRVWCWGNGIPDESGPRVSALPLEVTVLGTDVESLALGYQFNCALKKDHSLWCWTVGGEASPGLPIEVAALGRDVESIAVAWDHACAVMQNGDVRCWGNNNNGRCGIGSEEPEVAEPASTGLTDVVEVALKSGHSCARQSDGSVWCWGGNAYGQVGDGSTEDRSSPVKVPLTEPATEVSVGSSHTCALGSSGSLWCWGSPRYGCLGNGSVDTTPQPIPVQATELKASAAHEISCGGMFTCVLAEGDALWCWGRNSGGYLGAGTFDDPHPSAVEVTAFGTGVRAIAVGIAHSCATTHAGSTWCWGENSYGELGDGTREAKPSPVLVDIPCD